MQGETDRFDDAVFFYSKITTPLFDMKRFRSILTVPWVELGGSVSITCAKTGYSASVEFQTKPFYGGRKNRILAEVYQPLDKKAFVTITGEWNGAMVAKWIDGVRRQTCSNSNSLLFDTNLLT